MSGHRQAAAALYNLDERDQGLILAELPANDQAILRDYLAELAELGFDKGPAGTSMAAPVQQPGTAAADPRARLMGASAPVMYALLSQEPATMVASVLALECWPWTAQFMELLAPHRRTLVREAAGARRPAAQARDQFLIESLAAALARQPAAEAPAGVRMLSSVVARWTPWTR